MFENKVKINTLIKVLEHVKFNSKDEESRYFAGSPILGELMKDILISNNPNTSFEIKIPSPQWNLIKDGVEKNIERTLEWNNMARENKIKHLKNLLMPYIVNENIIFEFEVFGNNHHIR